MFRSFCAFALVLVVIPSLGCNQTKTIELDPRFSYNVVRVPEWFPPKKHQMTPAEQEVMQRRGRPDFMRFWWNPDGTFISSSDLSGKSLEINQIIQSAKQTWVYMRERQTEIEFKSSGGYFEHPVTEQLALICKYGDPTRKGVPKTENGHLKESWQWVDEGIQIDFIDGIEIKRNNFQPTGRGTILIK